MKFVQFQALEDGTIYALGDDGSIWVCRVKNVSRDTMGVLNYPWKRVGEDGLSTTDVRLR